ncbi:MAG: large conductance mechanosensitive channel protein MscL [Demequina sp.]
MIKGFRDFIARGNVVDLAVAVVIGAAFGAVVTSLVDNVINPIIAAIFGEPDMSAVLVWTLNDAGTADPSDDAVLAFGAFLTAVLNFLIIAAAIYFVIVLPLNKLAARRRKDEAAPDEAVGPTEIHLLTEIRDALAARPRE